MKVENRKTDSKPNPAGIVAADNDVQMALSLRRLSNYYWYRATTDPLANVRPYQCETCKCIRLSHYCETCLWKELASQRVKHAATKKSARKAVRKGEKR